MSDVQVSHLLGDAAVLFVAFICLTIGQTHAVCLPNAVPEAERQLIVFEEGAEGLPLGLWVQDWESAWLAATVASVVISEMLGINTTFSGWSDSTMPGITSLTGCTLSGAQLVCPDSEIAADNPHHASLEVWLWDDIYEEKFEQATLYRKPYYYEIGYTGIESQYVMSNVLDEAMEAEGAHLNYYGFYNAKWYEPWKYFDNPSSIPTDLLTPCSETDFEDTSDMSLVTQWTPDEGGVDEDGHAICEDGYWWRSPACRAHPDQCIPFMTGGTGWLLVPTMQRAIEFNMPIAIGTWKSYSDFLQKPFELRTLTYSWEPSMHFLSLGPERVSYPPVDVSAYRKGDMRSLRPSKVLQTLVTPTIATAAPRVLKTLGSLSLTDTDITYLLTQYMLLGDLEKAACEWLTNTSDWQEWIPLDTACSDGQGLADDKGNFVENRSDAVRCSSCSGGYFSVTVLDDIGASTKCQQCDAGSSQPMWGSESCELCAEGYYQGFTGQSACIRCPRGTYSTGKGSTACVSCAAGRSTDGTGYRSADDCKCTKDSYESTTGDCIPCGIGAVCDGFGAEPKALPGYHLAEVREDALWIFSCIVHPNRCPGGPHGTCSPGRESTACSECFSGYTAASDGACHPCSTADRLPFFFGLCFVFAGLCAVYFHSSQDTMDRSKQQAGILLILIVGQLVQVLQMLGVFARIAIDWPESLMSVWQALKSFSFEILDHMQLDCVADVGSLAAYVSKLALVPILCGILGLMHLVVCFIYHRHSSWQSRTYVIANAVGIAVLAFYIAVCLMVLSPFQCYRNPNGVWTMTQNNSVICWSSSQHHVMVVISILASFIPFSFLSYVVYVLLQFPSRTGRGDVNFLRNAAFILSRVRPRCRWWICFTLCRNLAIAMVPIIPTSVWQFFALVSILISSIVGTVRDMPNTSRLANWMEIATGVLLLWVVLLSAPYLDATDAHIPEVAILLLVLLSAIFLGTFLWIFFSRCIVSRRKSFRWFLCHHKVAAGSFARLLKIFLTSRGGDNAVFLDSDDLLDLGKLFECVSRDVDTLVVLATRDVFERSWCVGEVTVAYICKLKIVPIHFANFVLPTERSVQRLPEVLHIDHLIQNCLTIPKMQEAILHFAELQPLLVPEYLDESNFTAMAMSVYAGGATLGTRFRSSSATGSSDCSPDDRTNLLLVDNQKTEAVSAALILLRLLTLQLSSKPMMIPRMLPAAGKRVFPAPSTQQPVVLILFCTSGCFSSQDFVLGILQADNRKVKHMLPVVASADFQFPTHSFYQTLESTLATMGKASGYPLQGTELSPLVGAIFRKICRQLSPLASAEVLTVQADHILRSLMNWDGLELDQERSPGLRDALSGFLTHELWQRGCTSMEDGKPKAESTELWDSEAN